MSGPTILEHHNFPDLQTMGWSFGDPVFLHGLFGPSKSQIQEAEKEGKEVEAAT